MISDSVPLRAAVCFGALELDSNALRVHLHVGALLLHAPPQVAPLLCAVSDSPRLSFETDFFLPHAQFEQPICAVSGWRASFAPIADVAGDFLPAEYFSLFSPRLEQGGGYTSSPFNSNACHASG